MGACVGTPCILTPSLIFVRWAAEASGRPTVFVSKLGKKFMTSGEANMEDIVDFLDDKYVIS